MRLLIVVLSAMTGTVSAQSESDALAEANRKLEEIVTEVNDFVGGVRFDEADVESLIELWPEFDELEALLGGEDDDDEGRLDLDAVVADPEYRSWAASHGLDADDWLRKSTRITMVLYREQILQGAAMAPQQIEKQIRMIEQQREQIGEEMYQEMKAMVEASRAFSDKMAETASKLPEATSQEKVALEEHRDQLTVLMMADDEDEYVGYDEGYEYEYEYDDPDDGGGR
jgi:hypothetical protein